MASGMVGIAGAGTASAKQLSRTFGYTCTPFAAGSHSFTVQVTADLPDKIVVGQPGKTLAVHAVATADASVTKWVKDNGLSTVEGTVDASAHVDAPQQQVDIAAPFTMSRATVPASGSFKIRATAAVATPTFSHTGRATVTTGSISLYVIAWNAARTVNFQTRTSCSLNASQSNFVTSFDITTASSKPSATSKPTTGPAASTAPEHTTGSVAPAAPGRTSGSVADGVPKATVPKGAGRASERVTMPGAPRVEASGAVEDNSAQAKQSAAEPESVGNAPATGHGRWDLLLPGVGLLLACAAAFFLGTRLRNRRTTSDDAGEQRPLDPQQGLLSTGVGGGGSGIGHRRRVNAAERLPRVHVHGEPSRGSAGRSVKENGNVVLGRRASGQSDHRAPGPQAGDDAELSSQLPELLTAEEAKATIHEESGPVTSRRG
ncbi:DUF6801 domain-containing protein [Streptomyces sp. RTGN2]|uniref:DUF6801 domain-containing protein n=1 Tax=Streptomyces sp. RTGN2 TaxID=3016525 RepID=UPI002552421D|nr:DUF6801 domain-containing protein [Streptomyces sp. RTGN2]